MANTTPISVVDKPTSMKKIELNLEFMELNSMNSAKNNVRGFKNHVGPVLPHIRPIPTYQCGNALRSILMLPSRVSQRPVGLRLWVAVHMEHSFTYFKFNRDDNMGRN